MTSEIRNPYLRQSLYETALKIGSGELSPDEETLFQWIRFCTAKKYRYLYEYREITNPLLERKDDEDICSGEEPHAVCRILGIQTDRYLTWERVNFREQNSQLLHGNMQDKGKEQTAEKRKGNGGIYENLIHRDFRPLTRGEKYSIGIGVYTTKMDGPIYLAGIIDMYDKSAAGVMLGGYRSAELAGAAMDMILESKKANAPILHSSQNPIYRTKDYHQEIEARALTPSMTSPGERGGNAVISTFFSQIKRRMKGYQFEDWQDAVNWMENDLLLHRKVRIR